MPAVTFDCTLDDCQEDGQKVMFVTLTRVIEAVGGGCSSSLLTSEPLPAPQMAAILGACRPAEEEH